MKYLIMECRPGYAVAAGEDGSFLKVANKQYEVGQTVTDVIPMRLPKEKKPPKWLFSLAAMAACLALLLGVFLPGTSAPYASVYVKINPEVRIDVDKNDLVVGLSGINQDGIDLIQGYDYHKKDLDLVTDELVDRAIDMGYLTQEGKITISLESSDQTWIDSHSQSLSSHLQTHLQEKFVVEIYIQPRQDSTIPEDGTTSSETVHIPVFNNEDDDDFDDDFDENDYDEDDFHEDSYDEDDSDEDDSDNDSSDEDDSDDDGSDKDDSDDDDSDEDDSDDDDSDKDNEDD